jgi:hypothetical protein
MPSLFIVFVGGGEEGEGGEEEEDEEFCEALSEFEDGEGEQDWGATSPSPLQRSQVQPFVLHTEISCAVCLVQPLLSSSGHVFINYSLNKVYIQFIYLKLQVSHAFILKHLLYLLFWGGGE